MVITYSKSMDQPGKVANPARGQLNREEKKSLSRSRLVSSNKYAIYIISQRGWGSAKTKK